MGGNEALMALKSGDIHEQVRVKAVADARSGGVRSGCAEQRDLDGAVPGTGRFSGKPENLPAPEPEIVERRE